MSEKKKCTHLTRVLLSADVHSMCFLHALSTEREEVMGLLIGEADEETGVSQISALMILHRSTKQPDRVEISPEQLCSASTYAEELSARLKKSLRVLGWYHSHPHITVWPSHVDIQTQSVYQFMDPLFAGLIYAVYQSEKDSPESSMSVTAFQARKIDGGWERRPVPLEITNSPLQGYNMQEIINLPTILIKEEMDLRATIENNSDTDLMTVLHNDSLQNNALVHILTKVSLPMMEYLEARYKAGLQRVKALQKEKEDLVQQLNDMRVVSGSKIN